MTTIKTPLKPWCKPTVEVTAIKLARNGALLVSDNILQHKS